MPVHWLFAIVLVVAAAGYVAGRRRALATAGGRVRDMHSLPGTYGMNVLIWTAVPALLLLAAWILVQPVVLERQVIGSIPESAASDPGERSLIMSDVRRIAGGLQLAVRSGNLSAEEALDMRAEEADLRDRLGDLGIAVGSDPDQVSLDAAQKWFRVERVGGTARSGAVLAVMAVGLGWSLRRSTKDRNARASVEFGIGILLMGAALIAIATTVGIVLSMLFETLDFFSQYSWTAFFFSTDWNPRFQGGSDLGMIPLLWGTLYISLIALFVAVPIGLFAAVYLSEYAAPKLRAVAKPLIEVLAGIPTIVYGLFALITVGPFLRDYFSQPMGLGNSSASVMTAGLVMGIMLIPFVSSLSDDIINAVPQSLRDGSYGLGSTQSETVRHVVLPAALPGIVGAVLLAASRAIGETMIVVLGAGAAARMSLNPFEAMTTVTVKIVSQLTGDTDFNSPETLVAFALGLTLFAITLALNVLALYIVRRYREQYE